MTEESSATPEEAARGDIPPQFAKALSVEISPDGREALVVLATNEEPYVEPYEVVCYREGDGWVGGIGSGGLGIGWSSTLRSDDGRNVGVLRLAGQVPSDVDAVVVRWADADHHVPVKGGYFFFTQWDVPADFDETLGHPEATAYVRADGSVDAIPSDPFLERAWKWMREHRSADLT